MEQSGYQPPAVDSFDESEVLGDTPSMAPTHAFGSCIGVDCVG